MKPKKPVEFDPTDPEAHPPAAQPGVPPRGWPGYRNRSGRSGLDPLDAYAEQGHMQGTLLRMLFTSKLPLRNPVYLLIAAALGVIGVLPLVLVLIDLMLSPQPMNNGIAVLLVSSPLWVFGAALLVNVYRNLGAFVDEHRAWFNDHSRYILIALIVTAILVLGIPWAAPHIKRMVRVASGQPPTVAAGVEITTSQQAYTLDGPVTVSIRNSNTEPVYLVGRAGCGLGSYSTQVERLEGSDWISVMLLCPTLKPPHRNGEIYGQYVAHVLDAGKMVEMSLDNLAPLNPTSGDRYRLVYYLDLGDTPLYSNEFVLR